MIGGTCKRKNDKNNLFSLLTQFLVCSKIGACGCCVAASYAALRRGLPPRALRCFFRYNYCVWDALTLHRATINRNRRLIQLNQFNDMRAGNPSASANADGFFSLSSDEDVAGHGEDPFLFAYT
jgi:hypothetical protein